MPAKSAEGSIRKRGNRWYVRTRVKVLDPDTGAMVVKQIERPAGTSEKSAKAERKKIQARIDADSYVPSSLTVLELGQRWLREHVQPELKAGAAANYKSTFYKHVVPSLGGFKVEDCQPHLVTRLLNEKRGEGLSKATVAKIRRHLHAMFAFAQDEGLIANNPAAKPRKRGRKQSQQAKGTILSPVQISRFLEECSKVERHGRDREAKVTVDPEARWRLFFTVAAETGLRRGELIGLRWGDVNLLDRTIHVSRSIGQYDDPEGDDLSTKTGSDRTVPIRPGALAALEVLWRQAADSSDEAPVFATVERKRGRDGAMRAVGRPLNPRMVTRVFRRYADRAGLPAGVRLHDLRHTVISEAIKGGMDVLTVAAIAGHADPSTTTDTYGHLDEEWVKKVARSWAPVAPPSHDSSHTLPTSDAEQRGSEVAPLA
jgi:integrase